VAVYAVGEKILGQFMLLGKKFGAVYTVGEKNLGKNYTLSFFPMA
jgi:hypothetical protein